MSVHQLIIAIAVEFLKILIMVTAVITCAVVWRIIPLARLDSNYIVSVKELLDESVEVRRVYFQTLVVWNHNKSTRNVTEGIHLLLF